ncbi:MAG: carboxypeptidase-like regulatory domain-containing protein [Candidatus Acidiferrum sp.]
MTNNIFWEGENYFIDGNRAGGLLTKYLPIVETGMCTRTRPVVYSAVEMRVLRESGDFSGGRIIGQVTDERSGGYAAIDMPPKAETPLAGARIRLSGPAGTAILTSDQEGIYESESLPPAVYSLSLDLPDTEYAFDRTVDKRTLLGKKFSEANFAVVWNGSIEGEVRSSAGGPAHVWLSLKNTDTRYARVNPVFFRQNDANGHFRIGPLAPGRYKLTINPNGPSEESSYGTLYYPGGSRPEDAGVLEIGEGEHIKNVILAVSQLRERKLKVRVTWPDGKPAAGAWTYVAYQNTPEYEKLGNTTYFAKANQGGLAELHIYGDGRIRIFAEDITNDGKTIAGAPRYSIPIELDPANLPEEVDLGVSSRELLKVR